MTELPRRTDENEAKDYLLKNGNYIYVEKQKKRKDKRKVKE